MVLPLAVVSQEADVLYVLLAEACLDGGWLRLARVCRQWRQAVLDRWGPARLLSHEPTLLIGAPPEEPLAAPPSWDNDDSDDENLGAMIKKLGMFGDDHGKRFVAAIIRDLMTNAEESDRLLNRLGLPLTPPVLQHPTCISWVRGSLCVVEEQERSTMSTKPGRVQLFSPSGEQLQLLLPEQYGGEWLGRCLVDYPYQGPQAAASDGSALYIAHRNEQADSLNALYKLALPECTLVHEFTDNSFLLNPDEDDEDQQQWDIRLGAPAALAVVGSSLYVLDRGGESGDASVSIFSTFDLTYMSKFGAPANGSRHGSGKGELCSPEDMVLFDGELFITDTGNQRVQVFSLTGDFLRTIGGSGPATLEEPNGLCIFRERLVVSERHWNRAKDTGRLTIFCIDGTPLERLVLPFCPSRLCANHEQIFCCDYDGHRVYTIGVAA